MSANPSSANQRFQLVERVVRLVARGVPVEVVADAQGPVGVVGEVGELVEGPIEDGDAAHGTQAGAEGLEHSRGQSGRDGAEAGVEPFLGRRVAAVEPDGQTSSRLDPPGDLMERTARVGRVVQDADRVDQVEGPLGQRQVEQVGLEDHDVRAASAERGGLVDGGAQIDADDPGAVGTEQPGVAAAAAAGVEHQLARQVARVETPVLTRNVASSSSGRATS